MRVAIVAAGPGTRPAKPLAPLRTGETIMRRRTATRRATLGADMRITAGVGCTTALVIEPNPDVLFTRDELLAPR